MYQAFFFFKSAKVS